MRFNLEDISYQKKHIYISNSIVYAFACGHTEQQQQQQQQE